MILQDEFLTKNSGLPLEKFVNLYSDEFGKPPSQYFTGRFLQQGGKMAKRKAPSEQVGEDRKVRRLEGSNKTLKQKYEALLKEVERVERERDAVKQLEEISTFEIKPREKGGHSESVA